MRSGSGEVATAQLRIRMHTAKPSLRDWGIANGHCPRPSPSKQSPKCYSHGYYVNPEIQSMILPLNLPHASVERDLSDGSFKKLTLPRSMPAHAQAMSKQFGTSCSSWRFRKLESFLLVGRGGCNEDYYGYSSFWSLWYPCLWKLQRLNLGLTA